MNDYKSSEEWRFICEVKHIAGLPLKERRKVLEGIGNFRGIKEQIRLQNALIDLWEKKQNE